MANNLPKWDLTKIYKSPEKALEAIDSLRENAVTFITEYIDNVKDLSPDEFGKSIQDYEKLKNTIARLNIYSYLSNFDNNSKEKIALYKSININTNNIKNIISVYPVEIRNLSKSDYINKFSSPLVQKYRMWLDKTYTNNDYILISDINKDNYIDKNTVSETYIKIASNAEPKKIEDTAKNFTFLMNRLIKSEAMINKLKGYETPVSYKNKKNQIKDEDLNTFMNVINENKKLKKRLSGLAKKRIELEGKKYIDPSKKVAFTWDEAKEIVFNAYNDFSPELGNIVQQCFNEDWIYAKDTHDNKNMNFCIAGSSTYPFIHIEVSENLNFDDVKSLGHEISHGINFHLSRKQGVLQLAPSLILSETIAIFGEKLVTDYILKNEKNESRYAKIMEESLLCSVDSAITQASLHQFEEKLHATVLEKGDLSVKEIDDIWLKSRKELNDDNVGYSDWFEVHHFFMSPFYCYSYSVGECLANSLINNYKDGSHPDFVEKYTEMLTAGGSKTQAELLEPLGVDMSNSNTWHSGLKIIENGIDTYENMLYTIEKSHNKNKFNLSIYKIKEIKEQKSRID